MVYEPDLVKRYGGVSSFSKVQVATQSRSKFTTQKQCIDTAQLSNTLIKKGICKTVADQERPVATTHSSLNLLLLLQVHSRRPHLPLAFSSILYTGITDDSIIIDNHTRNYVCHRQERRTRRNASDI